MVLFVNGGTPIKIGPVINFWKLKMSIFLEKCRLCGNEEEFWKTKTTGMTTISRLSSHPRLVKFGSGACEL